MKKILVTGSNWPNGRKGFIGSRFVELYKDELDWEITEFQDDIREAEGIDLSMYDMVIHLAALAGVRRSHEIPNQYWETNVVASKYFFESCKKHNVPIVYASSSSVYEWWQSPYSASKYAMEALAPEGSIGLRFHTVYGPNSREDMLFDKLLKKDPSLKYLTHHTRDWTHVDDVCSAIALCVDNYDKIEESAIDVGNGKPVKVRDMANKYWPDNTLPIMEVDGERHDTCANPGILLGLGWQPQYHIMEDDTYILTDGTERRYDS